MLPSCKVGPVHEAGASNTEECGARSKYKIKILSTIEWGDESVSSTSEKQKCRYCCTTEMKHLERHKVLCREGDSSVQCYTVHRSQFQRFHIQVGAGASMSSTSTQHSRKIRWNSPPRRKSLRYSIEGEGGRPDDIHRERYSRLP